jgi:uncharacterized membrane protein YbhN (UPF0104 family)
VNKISIVSPEVSIFWIIITLLFHENSLWTEKSFILIVAMWPALMVVGWLSLLKLRDYEIEKEKFGEI